VHSKLKKMKKAQVNTLGITIMTLFIAGFFLIMGVIITQSIDETVDLDSAFINSVILSDNGTQNVLSQTPTTLTSTSFNKTWLDFESDDSVISERYDTISFWYKNSTVDWTFIVNSSGTLYVDGVAGTPGIFPVYDNGTNMLLGQTGASTFFNGSIDDFRGYASSIDEGLINLTYLGGRL